MRSTTIIAGERWLRKRSGIEFSKQSRLCLICPSALTTHAKLLLKRQLAHGTSLLRPETLFVGVCKLGNLAVAERLERRRDSS